MVSILRDDIRYIKLVLLLVKGGTFSAKRHILKCSTSDNKCIDDYLKENQDKLNFARKKNRISQRQISILFPSSTTTTTNLECWNISLLSFILLNIFDDKLDSHEKTAITALSDKRNDLAHSASTILSEVEFLGEWAHLTMVLYQLTKGLTTAEQDEINDTVSKILTIQDFCFATNELKSFEGSDEFVNSVVTEKLKCLEQGLNDCCNQVAELQVSSVKMETQQDIMARIIVSALTPAEGNTAQAKLLNALKQIVSGGQHQAGEQNQTDGDEVLTASNNFVSDMKDKGVDIVKVEKGSILIILRCSTISALKNITQYLADRMYEERLVELENALSQYLGSPVKLNISIVFETLYSALKQIEKDANNKSIVLTLQCRGSKGVKNAIDCFGNGSSTNALNTISEALSSYVGQRVELHTTIDVDITEFEQQLIIDDQNIVHELERHLAGMETSFESSTSESSPRSAPIEPSASYSPPSSSKTSIDSHQATIYRPQPSAYTHNLPTGLAFDTEEHTKHPDRCIRVWLKHKDLWSEEHTKHASRIRSWLHVIQNNICSECERLESRRATLKEIESFYSEEDAMSDATFPLHFGPTMKLRELPCGCIGDGLIGQYIPVEVLGAAGCAIDMAYLVGTAQLKNGLVYVPVIERHFGVDIGVFQLSFVAIAAKQMKETLNMKRILIFEWNASHGMGTQRATYDDKEILYISFHAKDPRCPYEEHGISHECGSRNAEGFNVNIASVEFGRDVSYLAAFRNIVMPIAREFNPELVLVSGGFDDPISPECSGHVTSEMMSLANGKVVLIAEVGNGISLECKSAEMCLKCLLEKEITPIKEDQLQERPSTDALQALARTIQIQLKYWPCLQKYLSEIQNLLADDRLGGNVLSALYGEDKKTWECGRVSSLPGSKPGLSMVYSTDKRTTHDASDKYDPIVTGPRLKMEHEETSPVKTKNKSEIL